MSDNAGVDGQQRTECTCTFQSCHDLGLVFGTLPFTSDRITVLCYARTADGGGGAGAHTGDTIVPGDEVFSVDKVQGSLGSSLAEDGTLRLTCTNTPLVIRFVRGGAASNEKDLGGRPTARLPKFPRDSSEGGAGGSRARKAPKKKLAAPWNVTGRGGGKRRKKASKDGEGRDDVAIIETLRQERLTTSGWLERVREVETSMQDDDHMGHLP